MACKHFAAGTPLPPVVSSAAGGMAAVTTYDEAVRFLARCIECPICKGAMPCTTSTSCGRCARRLCCARSRRHPEVHAALQVRAFWCRRVQRPCAAQELPAPLLPPVLQAVLPGQAGKGLRHVPHAHPLGQQAWLCAGLPLFPPMLCPLQTPLRPRTSLIALWSTLWSYAEHSVNPDIRQGVSRSPLAG